MKLRTRIMIAGGVLGALVGAGAAYLYLESNPVRVDEEGNEHLPPFKPGRALALGLGVMGVLKQITSSEREG